MKPCVLKEGKNDDPTLCVSFFTFQLYYHGETINVNVHVQNNSNRSVRKIKISGELPCFVELILPTTQIADVRSLKFPLVFQIPMVSLFSADRDFLLL
jgi:hypothetical protein